MILPVRHWHSQVTSAIAFDFISSIEFRSHEKNRVVILVKVRSDCSCRWSFDLLLSHHQSLSAFVVAKFRDNRRGDVKGSLQPAPPATRLEGYRFATIDALQS